MNYEIICMDCNKLIAITDMPDSYTDSWDWLCIECEIHF